MAFGRRAYLKNHQGASHSIFLSPLLAALVALPLTVLLVPDWKLFLLALLGIWLHILLDVCNTFGVAWLWPFSKRRDCLDAVFFIDLTAWAITAITLIGTLHTRNPWTAGAGGLALAAYFIGKACLRRCAMRRYGCSMLIPSSLNPLEFLALEVKQGSARAYRIRATTGRLYDEHIYESVPMKYTELAQKSRVFRDMNQIARFLFITQVEDRNDDILIVADDLGIRNFGGHFGRTTLRFDGAGNLLQESATI